MDDWLEPLLAHEAAYFAFGATCTRTPSAWFLEGPELSDYHDCNRALRLRGDGRPPDTIAREVIAHFRARRLPVVADLDPIAEAQGLGSALRRLGVTPITGSRLLMRYPHNTPPAPLKNHPNLLESGAPPLRIERVPRETGADEARDWIATAISAEEEPEEIAFWRAVAEHEARSPHCQLYLARWNGEPAGACDLFSHAGWGRIDSVVTAPKYRRRGIASLLTAHAVADSLTLGNAVTYLYTEDGGAGEQVYRKLGFTLWGRDVLHRHIGR